MLQGALASNADQCDIANGLIAQEGGGELKVAGVDLTMPENSLHGFDGDELHCHAGELGLLVRLVANGPAGVQRRQCRCPGLRVLAVLALQQRVAPQRVPHVTYVAEMRGVRVDKVARPNDRRETPSWIVDKSAPLLQAAFESLQKYA